MESIRDAMYSIDSLNKEIKRERFIEKSIEYVEKYGQFTIPMQLFESIFDFDFHRGVKHPISSNIHSMFKKKGLKISKKRNKYVLVVKKK